MKDLLVTKDILKTEFQDKMRTGGVYITDPVNSTPTMIGGRIDKANDDAMYRAVMDASGTRMQQGFRYTGKYGTPYDVPMDWADGAKMSVREAIRKGKLSLKRGAQASTNTLMPDWENLWQAIRLDISIRKAAIPTIRQFIYNELNRPDATRDVNIIEIYPYGIVFEENNGEGQAVPQGETRSGQYDSVRMRIYAAGFTWTLLAELFDMSLDMSMLSDAVAVGYNAKKDDLAISPILAAVYAGVQQTAAAVLAGAGRQELLYLTLQDAADDLGQRYDPVTNSLISANGLIVLAHEFDAPHISQVIQGLPSVNERFYPALGQYSRVLGYNGEYIALRDRTVHYTGVTKGKAYVIKPNRYLNVLIKRGLTIEVDPLPDIKTLAREERAYWFAEGIDYADGIANFIQEVTLPAW